MASDSTSGSASSFADVQTAIINFLTTHGWTDQSANAAGTRILSKSGLYLWIGNGATYLVAYPGTGRDGSGNLTGRPTTSLGVGSWDGAKMESPLAAPITFPISYEIIWHDDPEEVYVIINYGGDKYQHLNWGKSDIAGIGGTGMWLTGTYRADVDADGDATYSSKMFIQAYNENNGRGYIFLTPYSGMAGGYFYEGDGYSYTASFLHQGLETTPNNNNWSYPGPDQVGNLKQGPWHGAALLMLALPSSYNEAEVLIQAKTTIRRGSGLVTPGVILRHARRLRIDNVQPGEIITYGGDQWKCYPLHAKNTAQRDGVGWATGALHSGTLGVAIRLPAV
jgi:hypothetical protein